jgi:ankyrin repeat protein
VYRFKAKGQDLDEGDEDGWTGLMNESFHNHLNIAKYLVRRGAIVDTADNHEFTALMAASYRGHLDVSRFLCDSGADVNAANISGWTALIWAYAEGHLDIPWFLCDSGANVNAADKYDEQLSCSQVRKVTSRSSSTSPSKEPLCLQDIKTDAQPSPSPSSIITSQ